MDSDSLGVLSLLALAFLLFLHAFFAFGSAAILRARSRKIEDEDFDVSFGTNAALKLLKHAQLHVLSSQAGRFLSLIGIALALIQFYNSGFIANLPLTISSSLLNAIVLVLILFLSIFTGLILLHLAWSIAYSKPEESLCYTAPFLKPLLLLLSPFGYFAERLSMLLTKRLNLPSPVERLQAFSAEDLSEIVEYNDESADLLEDELEMLKGVVDLSNTLVEEIMTPRQDISFIQDNISIRAAVDGIIEAEFSRLLVIGESLDQVRGIIIARDLIGLVGEPLEEEKLSDYIRPVIMVPGNENLLKLLSDFRDQGAHFAVVMDEHGGVDGIVTLEDVLEEIVGDIFDEYDDPEEEQEHRQTHGGDILVDGGALVADLNDEYDLHIPEGEYDTIAGFIIDQLGKIPTNGEIIEHNTYQIIVEELSDNRINQVRIVNHDE